MFVTVYENIYNNTNSTFEDLLSDCVVLVLLDVGVKLPGQNHYVLFHLKETQEAHQSGLYKHTQTLKEHTEEVFQREAPTWYWELKLNENFMESVVMVSAITEGGGRAAAGKEQVSVEFVCFYLCFLVSFMAHQEILSVGFVCLIRGSSLHFSRYLNLIKFFC